MKRLIPRTLLLSCTLLALACGRSPDSATATTSTPATGPSNAEITWFDGDVNEAFAQAKVDQTPLFLYWGAVWCPPCNQLRSTVFKDPAFISMSRSFIAVYLDGDSEGAQRWGEHYGAIGYPTLIVFGPNGEERTRLTSGMSIERYPKALQAALEQTRSIQDIVRRARTQAETLDTAQWQLLADTAWDADDGRLLGKDAPADALLALSTHCPASASAACHRLRLLASIAALDSPTAAPDIANLQQILGDATLARANLSELQYYGVELSAAAPPESQAELRAALHQLAATSFADTTLPLKARMLATRLRMDLARDHDGELPDDDSDLQALVRTRASWADQAAETPVERQALIYNAAWYLHEVGLSDDAVSMLQAELERAVAPYYYMSYLAAIEKDRGNHTRSLGWSARAWQLASGPATRTQWGVQHVLNLLELAPEQSEIIQTVVNQILDGVAQARDGYYQRTRMRMQRLFAALQDWATDKPARQAVAQTLSQRIAALCQQSQTDCSDLAAPL